MNEHAAIEELDLWPYDAADRERARPDALAVARFELVTRGPHTLGWVDLTFATAEHVTVLCGVQIDLTALFRNDVRALSFPASAHALFDTAGATELTRYVLPHLRALVRGRNVPLEHVVSFAPCAAFTAARERGRPGAAPLRTALPRLARARAIVRAAKGAPVTLRGTDADMLAAVAHKLGTPVTRSSDPAAQTWFRLPAERVEAAAAVSVADRLDDTEPAPIRAACIEPATGTAARCVEFGAVLPLDRILAFVPPSAPAAERLWVVS